MAKVEPKTVGKAYLVISVGQLSNLLKLAKKRSIQERGKVSTATCLVLRSELVQFEDNEDLQFSSSYEVD